MKKILLLVCCFFSVYGMQNCDDEGYISDSEQSETRSPLNTCDRHCPKVRERQLALWDTVRSLNARVSDHHHKLDAHARDISGNQYSIEMLCRRELAQDAEIDRLEKKILATGIAHEKLQEQCSRLRLLLDRMETESLSEEAKDCNHCSGVRQAIESLREQQGNKYCALISSLGINAFVVFISYLIKAGCAYSEKCPVIMR